MRQVELLIVGGGPAGQAAALEAAAYGIDTLLVDEGPIPHGWMRRQVPHWYGERLPAPDTAKLAGERYDSARPALSAAAERGIEVRRGHFCWGIFDERVAGISDGTRAELVQAETILLATGSTDLPLAFQGRSLAGVLGGVAALDLLATWGSLGGERVVVLGAGNLGLEIARQSRVAGHTVVTIADIAEQPSGDPALVAELEASGVEFVPGVTIRYAQGTEGLEQVMLVPVDAEGRRTPGTPYPVRADTLVVAIGRAPAVELAYLAGCELDIDVRHGGYVVRHTPTMETTQPGVFVAGDVAGASDAAFLHPEQAAAQGRVAVAACARRLGKIADTSDAEASAPAGNGAPTDALPGDYQGRWQRAALHLGGDDLLICRCEGITRRELEHAMALVGDGVPDELKRVTRAGMGPCQGRGCRTIIAAMLAERHGGDLRSIPPASYRPPVRPVTLGALAATEQPAEDLLPAFAALERRLERDDAAGMLPAGRLGAARYKIREENHLALVQQLRDGDIDHIVAELEVMVRRVNVH